MIHILYTLTMPNVGSWDHKWTQAGKLHCRARSYSDKSLVPAKVLSMKNYYYNFGDGWGANVSCSKIDAKAKASYNKKSLGFCGYDWMIEEIEKYGRIKSVDERRAENAIASANK